MVEISKTRHRQAGVIFTKAYRRAKRALKQGFYLEALAITDSLITDRLRLICRFNIEMDVSRKATGQLASVLRECDVPSFDETLWNDVSSWARKRNRGAHEMGAISGDHLVPWRTRLLDARATAMEGIDLVNRLSVEARKHRL